LLAFAINDSRRSRPSAIANIRAYEGWWDTSLVDERNERALVTAFVAAVSAWTTVLLLALL
jgi:hypothetical protein